MGIRSMKNQALQGNLIKPYGAMLYYEILDAGCGPYQLTNGAKRGCCGRLNLKELTMVVEYKNCLKCGSSKETVKIIYGMPTDKLFQQEERGLVKLGGCINSENSPQYHCKKCQYEWNRKQAIDQAYANIQALEVYVGELFEGHTTVNINLVYLRILWHGPFSGIEEKPVTKLITKKTAEMFIDKLKTINLLNWKGKYVFPERFDSIHWSVKIFTGGKTITKYGCDMFPINWAAFRMIISQITGKDF